jgi:predicted permease
MTLAGCGLTVVAVGIALSYALGRWPGVDPRTHASGAQTAFRFNSYVALALAERLGGVQSVAWIALLIALCVPVCNVAAVWPLARHAGHNFLRELARNPLIVGTVTGLVGNLLGLRLPELAEITLSRIGGAALPLGLMAVGAGLRMGALKEAPGWPPRCWASVIWCCRSWPSPWCCSSVCHRRSRPWWWPLPPCPRPPAPMCWPCAWAGMAAMWPA